MFGDIPRTLCDSPVPYSRFVSSRMKRVAVSLAIAALATTCGPETPPSPSRSAADTALCKLVPVAHQVAIDLRTAADAARSRDAGSMTRAAKGAASGAERITEAMAGDLRDLPRSGSRFVASLHLASIANFGQQLDVLFGSGVMPDARSLASVESSLQLLAVAEQGLTEALVSADIAPC